VDRDQLKDTSVTVVLFGAQTPEREWVGHEIRRSHKPGKGLLAIDFHKVEDPQLGADVQGRNLLSYRLVKRGGRTIGSPAMGTIICPRRSRRPTKPPGAEASR